MKAHAQQQNLGGACSAHVYLRHAHPGQHDAALAAAARQQSGAHVLSGATSGQAVGGGGAAAQASQHP